MYDSYLQEQRTGYPDGGMSAREEELWDRLLEERKSLEALKDEREVAFEFLAQARFVDMDLKDRLREMYDRKLEQKTGDMARTAETLKSIA